MIRKLLKFSIEHPLIVIILTIAIAAYGAYSIVRLPIDAVPDITNNQVQINVTLPGYAPEQMEKQVAFIIETGLSGIPGLETTRSLSRNGFAQVTAVFDDDVNLYFARQQINERLNALKEDLPHGAEPEMGPISTGLGEIYMWTVDYAEPEKPYMTMDGRLLESDVERGAYLRTVQDWVIKPQLKGLQGVAELDSIGGYAQQYDIEPDVAKMIALGMTFEELIEAVQDHNVSVGPGNVARGGEALLVKADERIRTPKEIEEIVVAVRGGHPVKLKEMAKVVVGKEARSGSATKDGREVVIGTAMMLVGANSRTVSQAIDKKMEEVKASLPPGIEVETVLNRSKLVNATMATVAKNLSEGALLVILVLFLFLGQLKGAVIVALVIPLTMLLTAIGMVKGHLSGNLMSLGAIDFGLIVDGAVIIAENCLRRLNLLQAKKGDVLTNEERTEEMISATDEMIRPSLFGQAIIMVVYVPLLALTGVEGKMFHPMAMTVLMALLFAFMLSITFIPAALSLFLRGKIKEGGHAALAFASRLYTPLLEGSLKAPGKTVVITSCALLASLLLFQRLGQEFVPSLDEQDLAMHAIRIPSVSIDQSTKMQERVEKAVLSVEEVSHVFSKTGTAEMASDPMPPNVSDTFIMLKDKELWPDPSLSKEALIEKIATAVEKVPGNQYEFTQPIEMRFNELISGVKSDVAVKLYGDDYAKMQQGAEEIAAALGNIQGAADIKVGQTDGLPILSVDINRDLISRIGLTPKDALNILAIALGGADAGELTEGDKRFPIKVRLSEEERNDISALKALPLPLKNAKALSFPHVNLGQVASFSVTEGLNEIARENGKRFIAVEVNVRGSDLGTFVERAKDSLFHHVQIPRGSWVAFGGQFEHLVSAKERLLVVIPVCLALIYFLLYAALHSLKDALLVFSAIPMALTGGVLALYLRSMPFSISAAVGFIALSGIAVLNGLVLITSIRSLLARGENVEEAIRHGANLRLRPVLITALVASLGFVPMALSHGTGAEVQKPLATVVIGGLISSTFLTLVVLPALYLLFARPNKKTSLSANAV